MKEKAISGPFALLWSFPRRSIF